MNEMKLRVKSLFRESSKAFDLPEHPSKADLKRMWKFITGNPLVRIEILLDFWQMDYDELFSMFKKYSFQKSGDEPETFLDECIYQSEIEKLFLEIEFDVINDFKKWEIKQEDQQRTFSEIQRLLKKVEKWHYVKRINDNENFVSNRIKKALQERFDDNLIFPHFQLTFSSDEEIMRYKKILKEMVNDPAEQTKKDRFPKCILPIENQNKVAEICNSIFNKTNSPKVYAIMFCLLSDKGFIIVPNRRRKDHYLAWYYFIGRQLPKNNNFEGINKFIADAAANGLVFKDETDIDFVNLKTLFYKELLANNL